MKKVTQMLIVSLIICPLSLTCFTDRSFAFDYIADFIAENYNETADSGEAGAPKIYHTIQVDTELGSKILLLKGDDLSYRIWLRQYLVTAKKLIITIPNDQEGLFRVAKLFQIDVNMVHPISGSHWKEGEPVIGEVPAKPPYKGKKHILIVEENFKKRSLIEMVVKNLGFPVILASNANDALNIFRQQPDKFNLVIADSGVYQGVSTTILVKNIIETSPDTPVILGTNYKEEKITAMLTDFFAGFSSVIIKPLVLRELPKTILQVLEKKV